jgi:hypothetical protein
MTCEGASQLGKDVRMQTRILMTAVLAVICVSGCSQNNQAVPSGAATATSDPAAVAQAPTASSARQPASSSDADAIRSAIEVHLRNDHGINMSVMDMSIDSVSVNGDQAQANAAFHLKQGGTGMTMTYFLERHANGWLVMRNQPAGGQFVHPPMDKIHSPMSAGATTPPASASGMPDLTDFLKNHSTSGSN